jgi:hypothetical protein
MLRVTSTAGVILSEAKNLSDDVGKMARPRPEQTEGACPEQSEGMHRHILETMHPRLKRRWHRKHGQSLLEVGGYSVEDRRHLQIEDLAARSLSGQSGQSRLK